MAAVIHAAGKPLEVEELELAGPQDYEVLIRFTHSGLCHSDEHIADGDIPARLPMVLGHEGAGVIEEVGAGVTRVSVGDHVVCSFIPACGTCRYCSTGRQSICDIGATMMGGHLPSGRFPLTGPAGEYGAMCMLGTFSQYGVIHQASCVKIDDDLPLREAALVGCGVPTGWGSVVNTAGVVAGDTVAVFGVGGIGINSVQAARIMGAQYVIAVDPLENKLDAARRLGATHTFTDADEAILAVADLTRGQMADAAILTAGIVTSDIVDSGIAITGKGATIVITGMNRPDTLNVHVSGMHLATYRKSIRGNLFGDCNPTFDIPRILSLYKSGHYHLDELVTQTYRLDNVNTMFDDMREGRNLRGLIAHTH